MKTHTFQAVRATLAAFALAFTLVPALAQDENREIVVPIKDTAAVQKTASGNITQMDKGAIFIKGAGDEHPTGYNITADTNFVDDQGAPAQKANAKPGHGVIITYVVQNDTRVAITVVVRNAP